jgi:hypothetical protein
MAVSRSFGSLAAGFGACGECLVVQPFGFEVAEE